MFLSVVCFFVVALGGVLVGAGVRSAGGFHVTLHGAHACDRAPVRLPLQLHGLPVGRGLPPVRHHGVSHRRLPVLGVTHYK